VLVNVFEVDCWINVPPVAAEYQLNTGVVALVVDATLAVGIPLPHCVLAVVVGAVGTGLTLTVTEDVEEQPAAFVTVNE
jgi:hypothetical protein